MPDPVPARLLQPTLTSYAMLRPPGLSPHTNNDMEGSIQGLKTRYRRISGRKNWNSYLLRYERSVAYYD